MHIKKDNKEMVFLKTIQILNKTKFDYWICNGTLLGIIRDSKLISWDNDIDIALPETIQRDEIIEIFIESGYRLIDDGSSSDYVTLSFLDIPVDMNFFVKQQGILKSLWRVNIDNGFRFYIIKMLLKMKLGIPKSNVFWRLEGYTAPIDFIYPLGILDYHGEKISVPNRPSDLLEHTYGANWKVPNQDFNWRKDGENNAKG